MKKLILIFLLASNLLAQDYVVTSIVKIPEAKFDRVRIILNNFLVIENIQAFKDGSIELPIYKTFPQIEILDPKIEQEIIRAIKTYQEKVFSLEIEPTFEIKNIQLLKNSKRKANIEIILDKKISIVVGLMKGKKGDWIAWPASKKFDNKYHQDVYLLNAPLKEKIETAIFKTYLSKVKDKK